MGAASKTVQQLRMHTRISGRGRRLLGELASGPAGRRMYPARRLLERSRGPVLHRSSRDKFGHGTVYPGLPERPCGDPWCGGQEGKGLEHAASVLGPKWSRLQSNGSRSMEPDSESAPQVGSARVQQR
eukprot:1408197-Rhodomonas_salina.2